MNFAIQFYFRFNSASDEKTQKSTSHKLCFACNISNLACIVCNIWWMRNNESFCQFYFCQRIVNRIAKIHVQSHALCVSLYLNILEIVCFIFRMIYFPCDFPFASCVEFSFFRSTKYFAQFGLAKKGSQRCSFVPDRRKKKLHVRQSITSKNQIMKKKQKHEKNWNCEFFHLSIAALWPTVYGKTKHEHFFCFHNEIQLL